MEQRIQDIKRASESLSERINNRVQTLNQVAESLESRIEDVRQLLVKITKERDKAIRLYSPSYYPVDRTLIIEYEPIIYEPIPLLGREELKSIGLNELKQHNLDLVESLNQEQSDEFFRQTSSISESLKQSYKSNKKQPLESIRNVSSLLVYHTYESRLIRRGLHPQPRDSIQSRRNPSDSSIQDYNNRSFKFKSSKGDRSVMINNSINRSTSNNHLENNLGPAPDSIMRYHQNSLMDPEIIDNMDLLASQLDHDDETDLLDENLPDILPSLSNVVRDVSLDAEHLRRFDSPSKRHNISTPTNSGVIGKPGSIVANDVLAASPIASNAPPPPPLPVTPLHNVPPIKVELTRPVAAVRRSTLTNIARAQPSASTSLASPPPPPPPPPPLPPNHNGLNEQDAIPPPPVVAGDTGRGALLAEIRSAACKPRRRATTEKQVSSDRKESVPKGGIPANSKPFKDHSQKVPRKPLPATETNPRDSLLASIREAAGRPKPGGGGSIRSRRLDEKREQKRLETDIKQSNKADSPIDLMSDLVNKLRARRDGISGSVASQNNPVNIPRNENLYPSSSNTTNTDPLHDDVLSKVSRMIPTRKKDSSESDRNSEEFNEEDWN